MLQLQTSGSKCFGLPYISRASLLHHLSLKQDRDVIGPFRDARGQKLQRTPALFADRFHLATIFRFFLFACDLKDGHLQRLRKWVSFASVFCEKRPVRSTLMYCMNKISNCSNVSATVKQKTNIQKCQSRSTIHTYSLYGELFCFVCFQIGNADWPRACFP